MEISHLKSNSTKILFIVYSQLDQMIPGRNILKDPVPFKRRRKSLQTSMIRNIKTWFGHYRQNNGYYYTSIKI